jgi:F-type H+-transporting ATPase subunit delta
MKANKQVIRNARRVFRLCLVDGALDEQRVREAAQWILRSNRRGAHALLTRFLRLVKHDRFRRSAEVECATPLPADLQTDVRAALAQIYGPETLISFTQNPGLIGGIRVKVGDDVYDGSVKARIATLEKSF